MVSPLFQRNLINNFIGKSPDQNGSERLEGHRPQAPVGAEAESPGEANTTPSSACGSFLPGPACGSSPLYRRALSGAALTVGRARAQHRKWSQSKCLHASLLLVLDWAGHLSLALGSASSSSVLAPRLQQLSRGEELGWALSIAVLGHGVPVCVLVLHTLGRGPALSQAQFEVIFHCHEEVLERHGCPVEEALQEELLVGLQAAGHAVLVGAAAAVGQAAVAAVLLCAGDADITAAVGQQILPFTDVP